MRRCSVVLLAAAVVLCTGLRAQSRGAGRVVVLIVVDQMRADYLDHYAFTGGFKRLRDGGAVFTEARYPYASNKTAQAHALMVTGWSPSVTGIVGDRWWDRHAATFAQAGLATDHKLLETGGEGGSPEQLLVHSVGDALREQHPQSMVWTASWKRYTAVMNGGHHPNAAFWLDEATGHMATSDYYLREYPAWAARFAHADLTLPFFKTTWLSHTFGSGDAPDPRYRAAVRYSPASNAVLLDFATALFDESGVGKDSEPDFVALSFSGVDYVGHEYGPDTPEFNDTIMKLDQHLGALLTTLDARFGAGGYSIALTSDHGAPPLPETLKARGIDAGKMNQQTFREAVEKAVTSKLGISGPAIAAFEWPDMYLNYAGAAGQGVSRAALDRAVVAAVQSQPGIAHAYTVDDIATAAASHDPLLEAVAAGYYSDRSGDIYVLVKPNYIFWGVPAGAQKNQGIQHGTPYDYDVHVPLIFYGAGVKPGRYTERVRMVELAPTIGKLLGVSFKGDPRGRVLSEALVP